MPYNVSQETVEAVSASIYETPAELLALVLSQGVGSPYSLRRIRYPEYS